MLLLGLSQTATASVGKVWAALSALTDNCPKPEQPSNEGMKPWEQIPNSLHKKKINAGAKRGAGDVPDAGFKNVGCRIWRGT